MNQNRIALRNLTFTGARVPTASLSFKNGLNVVYGASNTGKSFALKAIDFMLGAKELPPIEQLNGYESALLGFEVLGVGEFTLKRSVKGGAFSLYEGLQAVAHSTASSARRLSPTHGKNGLDNISQFFLKQIGLLGTRIVRNASGQQDDLSFRDIAAISLVSETQIYSEHSPIETGQHTSRTKERSILRLLLAGTDDSSITPLEDKKSFAASKAGRLDLLDQMIADVESQLGEYADINDLTEQNHRLDVAIDGVKAEMNKAQESISELLIEKRRLSFEISDAAGRIEEIRIHLERFSKLDGVYVSDLSRLEGLEETTFLLSLQTERECPLCGALPGDQHERTEIEDIGTLQRAAVSEIAKIKVQRADLTATISSLGIELEKLEGDLLEMTGYLDSAQQAIAARTPETSGLQKKYQELLSARESVRGGISLVNQRGALIERKQQLENTEKGSNQKIQLAVAPNRAHEFCTYVSDVLKEWGFPGDVQVALDERTYDLKIDGKYRVDNGKGIRALTHAAFKVALLLFCGDRNLPHPGFLVLDTPLLTYRDPLTSRQGQLSQDEMALKDHPVMRRFFQHLGSLSDRGQFIVLENVDPPADVSKEAHVHVFHGRDGDEREGFFQN